jgi:putative peptidoglycan lipid II flippase
MKKEFAIGFLVFLQLAGQFISQFLIVRFLGVGVETDVYISSQSLPLLIGGIITSTVQSVWMPKLSNCKDDYNWNQEISVALTQILLISLFLIFAITLILNFWGEVFNPGFSIDQILQYKKYSIISLTALLFLNLSSVLTIALRSKENFVKSEFVVTASSIMTLPIVYFVLPIKGVEFLLYAFLLRNIFIFIYLLSITSWPRISLNNQIIKKEIWVAMIPLFIGASIFKTSILVDRFWASQATIGAITILSLAQTLMTASATILERTLAAPLVPKMSRYVYLENFETIKLMISKLLIKSAIFVSCILFLVFVFVKYLALLITFLLGISISDSNEILVSFICLGGHLYSAIVGGLIVSVYYAFGDTLTPVIIGLFGFFLGIFLKWVLFDYCGIFGLSLANSIYFFSNIILFLYFLKFKTNIYGKRLQLFGK